MGGEGGRGPGHCRHGYYDCDWRYTNADVTILELSELKRTSFQAYNHVWPIRVEILRRTNPPSRLTTRMTVCTAHRTLITELFREGDFNYFESAVVHEEWIAERTFL